MRAGSKKCCCVRSFEETECINSILPRNFLDMSDKKLVLVVFAKIIPQFLYYNVYHIYSKRNYIFVNKTFKHKKINEPLCMFSNDCGINGWDVEGKRCSFRNCLHRSAVWSYGVTEVQSKE